MKHLTATSDVLISHCKCINLVTSLDYQFYLYLFYYTQAKLPGLCLETTTGWNISEWILNIKWNTFRKLCRYALMIRKQWWIAILEPLLKLKVRQSTVAAAYCAVTCYPREKISSELKTIFIDAIKIISNIKSQYLRSRVFKL